MIYRMRWHYCPILLCLSHRKQYKKANSICFINLKKHDTICIAISYSEDLIEIIPALLRAHFNPEVLTLATPKCEDKGFCLPKSS